MSVEPDGAMRRRAAGADRLTILAVDDERSQLEDLARLLRSSPGVREVECAYGGREALLKASSQPFDAIFLDVRMPDLDGLELARVLRRFAAPPQLVFVSAYDSPAADAFELRALDYLRKPVGRGRVQEAIDRVWAAIEARAEAGDRAARLPGPPADDDREMIAVANLHGGSTRLLARSSILFVQSYGDFVRIVTADGRYLLRCTLAEIERRWEPRGFVRVHRQYVANLRNAVELRPLLGGTAELSFADGQTIPVARRHAGELARRLGV
ncbi:MAG TPA: LytTR family DNA-binding domain-containing protein [Solirubrobacteraceae bacterium]|nr:LytTR family DNA-binding domain-containing protein [Solirubrobacteraceae bacterium]